MVATAQAPDEQGAPSRRQGPEGLRAAERSMSILFTLAEHPEGLTLADLARHSGLTLTTAHRMVSSLRSQRLTRETPDGLQALGPGTLVLARGFLGGLDFRVEALPVLSELRELTGETCHLGTLAPPYIVYVDKLDSIHPVRVASRIGATAPSVSTALGRALLAWSAAPVVDAVAESTLAQLGSAVDRGELNVMLAATRQRGYSIDYGDHQDDVGCVGAPILDESGDVIAAISISVPRVRFPQSRVPELGRLVAAAALRISQAIGYGGEGQENEA